MRIGAPCRQPWYRCALNGKSVGFGSRHLNLSRQNSERNGRQADDRRAGAANLILGGYFEAADVERSGGLQSSASTSTASEAASSRVVRRRPLLAPRQRNSAYWRPVLRSRYGCRKIGPGAWETIVTELTPEEAREKCHKHLVLGTSA